MMLGLDPRVTALGAARGNAAYGARGLTEGDQATRHAAVEQIVRMALGGVRPYDDTAYAVLDGYDENGDIVAEYGIRDARTFRFLYRKLGWRQSTDHMNRSE